MVCLLHDCAPCVKTNLYQPLFGRLMAISLRLLLVLFRKPINHKINQSMINVSFKSGYNLMNKCDNDPTKNLNRKGQGSLGCIQRNGDGFDGFAQ